MRYAIYYTPDPDHPLTQAAAAWLGRDAFAGELFPPRPADGLSADALALHTASARRYGFHATLKAPFRLAPGESEAVLVAAFDHFCATARPVSAARLIIGQIDGFFALVPESQNTALDDLAGRAVTAFDRFRAPPSEADIRKRNPDALCPAEFENLQRWGYPYVFESFRFHMTLTDRIAPEESAGMRRLLDHIFTPLLTQPIEIGSLALFVEPAAGAPFTVRSFRRLGSIQERKTA